jgi:protein-tyrosine phosphatase
MIRVCFVCLGNICRSPIGEGVMRHLVEQAGLADQIAIDSAGTAGYHEGDPPDARARAAGKRRGIAVAGCARQFRPRDLERFEYVLAMDQSNLRELCDMRRELGRGAEPVLLRSFDAQSPAGAAVPDPYYGGDAGFDEVLELCLRACSALLARIRKEHAL